MLHSPELWVAVAFVIFVALAWKPVGRALTGALDARAARIEKDLEEAARLREEAQALLAGFERKHRDALKEAEEIVARARAEADRMAADARAELERTIKRREELAVQWIAQAEAKALAEVRAAAVDLAVAATAKLLTNKLDGPRADALVDRAIAELPARLN